MVSARVIVIESVTSGWTLDFLARTCGTGCSCGFGWENARTRERERNPALGLRACVIEYPLSKQETLRGQVRQHSEWGGGSRVSI